MAESPRTPYTKPQLRTLGSVRALTLGAGGALPDAGLGNMPLPDLGGGGEPPAISGT